jgi:hypothetical protein
VSAAGVVEVVVGVILLVLGTARARAPWRNLQNLQATQSNLRRYESWRGGRYAQQGESSADLMAAELRRKVARWGGVAGVGAGLILLGVFVG